MSASALGWANDCSAAADMRLARAVPISCWTMCCQSERWMLKASAASCTALHRGSS